MTDTKEPELLPCLCGATNIMCCTFHTSPPNCRLVNATRAQPEPQLPMEMVEMLTKVIGHTMYETAKATPKTMAEACVAVIMPDLVKVMEAIVLALSRFEHIAETDAPHYRSVKTIKALRQALAALDKMGVK